VRATMSDAGFGTVHPGMQPGLSRGGARSKVKYDGDIGGRDDDQQLSLSAGSNGSSTTSKHRAIKKRSPSYIEEDDVSRCRHCRHCRRRSSSCSRHVAVVVIVVVCRLNAIDHHRMPIQHKDRDYEHEDSMMPFEEYTNEVGGQQLYNRHTTTAVTIITTTAITDQ
jgi:hypothetical protein